MSGGRAVEAQALIKLSCRVLRSAFRGETPTPPINIICDAVSDADHGTTETAVYGFACIIINLAQLLADATGDDGDRLFERMMSTPIIRTLGE